MSQGEFLSAIDARLQAPGPKRILSLDGGGVKGILTAGMLEVIEDRLRARIPDPEAKEKFRLCDYFDLIGGTSTGAIIAALLALGLKAEQVTEAYRAFCPGIFKPGFRVPIFQSIYDPKNFERVIRATLAEIARRYGRDLDAMTLDTEMLRTGFAVFCKRADTGSPWMLTNNPRSMYWDHATGPWAEYWRGVFEREDDKPFHPNAKYPLGDVVRASAAAPLFLEAAKIKIGDEKTGVFVDGAVSTSNNPALQLFVTAALRGYDQRAVDDGRRTPFGFRWATGPENLFLLSLGTGSRREKMRFRKYVVTEQVEAVRAVTALTTIIADTVNNAVAVLQALSAPAKPVTLNSELSNIDGLLASDTPLLTFRRVDPSIELDKLDAEAPGGPPGRRKSSWRDHAKRVGQLSDLDRADPRNLDWLHHIGRVHAERAVDEKDFPAAFDIEVMGGPDGRAARQADEADPALVARIAEVVHEALRAWKLSAGEESHPHWNEAPEWMRSSTLESVRFRIANPSAPASVEHERWMAERARDGWRRGPEKDETAKTHPMMIPYAELPEDERKKDALIISVVDALIR